MERELKTIWFLMICFVLSCTANKMNSPHAPPVSAIRDDQYVYPFGKFYAASSESFISLGFVHPSLNSPIVWVRGEPIEISVDTPETVVERLGKPDAHNEEQLVYRSNAVGVGPAAVFRVSGRGFSTIGIEDEGGISLTKDSEILTIPFSRDDLIRVFGRPKEFIKAK